MSPSGRPYMVMELVQGDSLKELIEKRCQLDVRLAMEIAIQISLALDHANERGIVHRDLKAQNVMVSWLDDGSPRRSRRQNSSFEAAMKNPKFKFSFLRLVSLIPYLVLVFY
jgi:serine/threonine protein kinase